MNRKVAINYHLIKDSLQYLIYGNNLASVFNNNRRVENGMGKIREGNWDWLESDGIDFGGIRILLNPNFNIFLCQK